MRRPDLSSLSIYLSISLSLSTWLSPVGRLGDEKARFLSLSLSSSISIFLYGQAIEVGSFLFYVSLLTWYVSRQ